LRHRCSVKRLLGESKGIKYYSVGLGCAIGIPKELIKEESPKRVVYGGGIGGEDCAYILGYSEAVRETT
jgi:hypothetical protein